METHASTHKLQSKLYPIPMALCQETLALLQIFAVVYVSLLMQPADDRPVQIGERLDRPAGQRFLN